MTKILIYRLSSIGDIVLTTPIIRCLRSQYPDAVIHYITRTRFAETLQNNPYLDQLILVDKSPREVLSQLRAEKYDYIIDLHKNIRSLFLRVLLYRARSSSFPKVNISKWLLVNFKWNILPKKHIVDRYFYALRKLKTQNDSQGLDWCFPDETVEIPFIPDSPFIAISLSGNYYTKCYPPDQIINVMKMINLPFVLLGGKDQKETSDWICKNTTSSVVNLCGQLSLMQSALVIQKSAVCVANDTGLMHITAALKKPLVSIWGNTVTDFGMYPYYPDSCKNHFHIIENKSINCRPCSKLGYKKCPKDHFYCMRKIDPVWIKNSIESLI